MSGERSSGMHSVTVSARKGIVYVAPTIGFVEVAPVFTAAVDADEVTAALEGAIAAIPAEQVLPPGANPYPPSPVLAAMGVSGPAYERGLQSAVLRFADDGYRFYRYVPDPKYKVGLRREEEPVFTVPIDTPIRAVAKNIVASLNDSTWPIRKPQAPR
jgi:hypothetical protein